MSRAHYDGVVIGSGPNGLAAAITLAQRGLSVCVFEGNSTIGGGTRTAECTLPGFLHDVCSAVHPMGAASPFFSTLPLGEHGLQWIHSPAALAHPLDDGTAVTLERSLAATAQQLGEDANRYHDLLSPFVDDWEKLKSDLLAPLRWPKRPFKMAHFGSLALRPAQKLARTHFRGEGARALFAGLAAHSVLPLDSWGSAAVGLVLAIAGHTAGWPIARSGSQSIADALASHLRSLGGEIVTGRWIRNLDDLEPARIILCDTSPRGLLSLAGGRLSAGFRSQLERYRYSAGVFKLDYALDAPIPWTARECARAATVHLGGTLSEIAESEAAPFQGREAERPFVLLAQPSLFDETRAPKGKHTAWAYCHVPNGSQFDMTDRIEAQIERFARGFRSRILARSKRFPADLEKDNPNLVGGDIGGGLQNLRQLFARPTRRLYSTGVKGLYLCSSSTPPGGGVHGMCGYYAALRALEAFDLA